MNHHTSVQDAFKHNKARRQVIVGGLVLLVAITVISCVSSFQIYKLGFTDLPEPMPRILALVAVVVVEGGFVWLVFGFTRAFASAAERAIAFFGMCFLVGVMCVNIVTHFMMVKNLELSAFQHAWLGWGAITVFIAVLLFVLFITLADPVIRLIRLELKYTGKQQEIILDAKSEGLESERIRTAMVERADMEAIELADRIVGGSRRLSSNSAPRAIGLVPPPRTQPTDASFRGERAWRVNPDGSKTLVESTYPEDVIGTTVPKA